MSATLDREELETKLDVAKLALAKSDLIPSLQTFLINGKKITAWNDILSITVEAEVSLSSSPVCPKGSVLTNFVKRADGEMVSFDVGDNSLHVSSGPTNMDIPVQDANEYPDLPTGENDGKEWSAQVGTGKVSFALDKCLKTVGSQKDFLIYNAICIGNDPDTGNLTFYSSDDISLSKYQTPEHVGSVNWVLVPKEFAKALQTALDKLGDNDEMTITVYPNFVKVDTFSGVHLLGRRISGDPLDYNKPIQTYLGMIGSEEDMIPISPDMKSTVDRVKALLPNGSNVVLEIDGSRLTFHSEKDASVYVWDEVPLPYALADVSTTVGIDRLAKAVSAGDFLFINEDCIGVLNGPVEEATYTHMVASTNK